ncbi:hypothetical protein KSX_08110 [Ktedonospora formicarum]|uniref:Uncharacterized protein n=1 Tax=Ktedonospora formicarum TaxID=2778364 RepID=A0A8J3HY37_9CHLR|nr:hypothetical protein KSX_08110 [Ktedonospora formicarum]
MVIPLWTQKFDRHIIKNSNTSLIYLLRSSNTRRLILSTETKIYSNGRLQRASSERIKTTDFDKIKGAINYG